MRLVVALALALFVVGAPGCLDVDSPDGALICSTVPKRACPEGYYCLVSSNTCWRYGHFPDDMAVPTQFNPGEPDDFSAPVTDDMTLDGGAVDASTLDGASTPADLLQSD